MQTLIPHPEYFFFGVIIGATLLMMLVGMIGIVLPVLPGLPLIWGAALIFGLLVGFGNSGPYLFAFITSLWALGVFSSFYLGQANVQAAGASYKTTLASLGLGVIGFFVIPVIGFFVGALLGVLVTEYWQRRNWQTAWNSTRAFIKGTLIGSLVEFAIGFHMILLWVVWVVIDGFILRSIGISL
jgi:uncharacterized protein YqgC (DUF456 family)